jgi:hypothetical protein
LPSTIAFERIEAGDSPKMRRAPFTDRTPASRDAVSETGPCAWRRGLCARQGTREFLAQIEAELGMAWEAEPEVYYCSKHTPLVVRDALRTLNAYRLFLESD